VDRLDTSTARTTIGPIPSLPSTSTVQARADERPDFEHVAGAGNETDFTDTPPRGNR